MDPRATIQRFGLAGSTFLLHLPADMFERIWEWYTYEVDYLPLAASAQMAQGLFQIENKTDFCLCEMTQVMRTTADPTVIVPNPACLVSITKQGSGRAFMPQQVDILNIFGTVENPKVLEVPKLLTQNTTVQTFVTNLDTVNARSLRLGFSGFAVY